jgi:hypothetical protein
MFKPQSTPNMPIHQPVPPPMRPTLTLQLSYQKGVPQTLTIRLPLPRPPHLPLPTSLPMRQQLTLRQMPTPLSQTISLPPPPPLLTTKHITRTQHLHRPLHSSLPLPTHSTQKHMNKSTTRRRHRPLPNHLHRPVPVPPNHKLTSGLGPKIPPCDFESGCQGPTPGPGKAPGPGQAPHPEESRIEPAAAHGRASYGGYLYEVLASPIARLGGNSECAWRTGRLKHIHGSTPPAAGRFVVSISINKTAEGRVPPPPPWLEAQG